MQSKVNHSKVKYMEDNKYYNRKEVAKILSVNPMTIYREIQRGKIDAIRVGNDYRISEKALYEYIKNQSVKKETKSE